MVLSSKKSLPVPTVILDSDLGQAIIRLIVGGAALFLMLYFEAMDFQTLIASKSTGLFFLVLASYLVASPIVTFLTIRYYPLRGGINQTRRSISAVFDISLAAMGLHLTGEYSLIMFSVIITIIIGYGFRFGLRYLLLCVVVGVCAVLGLGKFSPFYIENSFLTSGLLVGIILVPTYAAFLLAKYQKILYQLEETNQARARFIANMSHELRTPLHAIIMNTDSLLEREYETKSHNTAMSPLRVIAESSNHLKRLVDRVLDIASSNADSFTLGEPKRLDLFRLLAGAVDIGAAEAKNKPVRVSLTIEPSTPRFILGWSQQLMEVLINTVGNAAKYTDKGYITVQVHARCRAPDEDQSRLFITVSDSGCGMSEKQLSTAFDPFVLGDDSRSRHFGGTGIGLTITKQYVEAMLGSIELSSQPREGTAVDINIPYTEIETPYDLECSEETVIVLIANIDAPNNKYNTRELAGLGIRLINGKKFSLTLDEIERLDCILIDEGLFDDIEIAEVENSLLNFNVPIVLVGDCNVGSQKIPTLFTYKVSTITTETLSDIDALCSNRKVSQIVPLDMHTDVNSKRILIIDDNEINLASANLVLTNAGHVVDAVTAGDDAISKLRVRNYDLIFLDMHMPGKNGIETLKLAREVIGNKLPPVVFLTADVTKQAEMDAINASVAGLLTKPVNSATLRAAVQEYANPSETGRGTLVDEVLSVSEGSQAYLEVDAMLTTGIPTEAIDLLIHKFLEDFNRDLLQCGIAAAGSNEERVGKLLHRMQGSAAAMHFPTLLEQLKTIELESKARICSSFLGSVQAIQELANVLAKDLRGYLFHQN